MNVLANVNVRTVRVRSLQVQGDRMNDALGQYAAKTHLRFADP